MSPWRQVEIGLQDAFEEFRRATQPKHSGGGDSHLEDAEDSMADPVPSTAPTPDARALLTGDCFALVDAAIRSLDTPCPDALALPTLARNVVRAVAKTALEPGRWNSAALRPAARRLCGWLTTVGRRALVQAALRKTHEQGHFQRLT